MKKAAITLLITLSLLSGCETMQGFGRDMKKAGQNLEDIAKSATF